MLTPRALVLCACTAAATPAILAAQPQPLPAVAVPQVPPAPPIAAPMALRPRPVQAMTLTTSAWSDGGAIPAAHAQSGRDVSPPLSWTGVPDGTQSFVLVMRDLDETVPATGESRLHWLVWNIPASQASLPAGVPEGNAPEPPRSPGVPPRPPGRLRQISATGPAYRGPAAPASGPPHHYLFELYALDTWLDVPAVGASPAQTHAAVVSAMAGRVRGKGVLVGTYRRSTP